MATYPTTRFDLAEYRDIAELEDLELRQLVTSDEPRVRVWAAWALGLRLCDAASPIVRDAIAAEPVAGVRRHLLVMLAGFGEVDIVAALARHDPDDDVRKTAARFVAELAVKHPDAYSIAAQLLDDRHASTRASLIDGLPAVVPQFIEDRLSAARNDGSEDVRAAMARRDATTADLATLKRTATVESNNVVRRHALEALVERSSVAEALQMLDAPELRRAISDLKATHFTATFDEISPLNPGPAFLDIVLVDELGVAGRIWLLGLVDRPIRDFWDTVARAYAPIDVVDDISERRALEAFLANVSDSLRGPIPDAEPEGALTEWGNWSPWEAQRRQLLDLLSQKLG